MDEEKINQIEEVLEDYPDEVRRFVFGEEMETIKKKLSDIAEGERTGTEIFNDVMLYLLGVFSVEDVVKKIDSLSLPQEKKQEIKVVIQRDVIEELLLLIEVHEEMEGETLPTTPPVTPKPTTQTVDLMETMKNRLTRSSTIAPAARELGAGGITQVTKKDFTPPTPPRPIDPYREIPK